MMYLVSANGLTVQVSGYGRDEQSCLHGSIPCQTLTYALRLIETANKIIMNYASVTVNVTCNQTINTTNAYNFNSSSVTNITVHGYNDSYLYFQGHGSLRIMCNPASMVANSGLTWTWVKLGFVRISPLCILCDSCNPALDVHVRMYGDTLNIFQCKFMSTEWNIVGVQNIIINGSVFGTTSLCPSVGIYNTGNSDNKGVVIISNNDFQNCLFFQSSLSSILYIYNERFSSTEVFSNKFSELLSSNCKFLKFSQSTISITGNPTVIILKKNLFVGNSLVFVNIQVDVTNLSIQNNTFHHNRNNHTAADLELNIIYIYLSLSTATYNNSFEMSVVNNDFKSNTDSSLIFIDINHISNTILSILITYLVAVNNSGISELIIVQKTACLNVSICMEMELLQVENNNVHIKAEFLEISVETSIIKLKNIDKLFLVNSSFKNNLDTSLLVEFEQVGSSRQELCVLGSNHCISTKFWLSWRSISTS